MVKRSYLSFMLYLAIAFLVAIVAGLISRGIVDTEVKEIIRDCATLVALVITAYGCLKTFSKKK